MYRFFPSSILSAGNPPDRIMLPPKKLLPEWARKQAKEEARTRVFLSYCHADRLLVAALAKFIEEHAAAVYVDWLDDRLPELPSHETARILRDAIRDSDRFLCLVTPSSERSIWIPWELGSADVVHGEKRISLVFAAELETDWTAGREYLGLYAMLRKNVFDEFVIEPPSDGAATIPFRQWLELA